jgi:hypothetical protein
LKTACGGTRALEEGVTIMFVMTPSELLSPEEVWERFRTGADLDEQDYVLWSVDDGHSCSNVKTFLELWQHGPPAGNA